MSVQFTAASKQSAMTQHRGLVSRQQQDALLVADQVWQADDLPPRGQSPRSAEGVCAVADGVAASFKPQMASRALLEILRDAQHDASDRHQDGWIGPRALRRWIHPRLCRRLSPQPALRGGATTLAMLQWRDGHYSALNVGDSRIYRISADGAWRQDKSAWRRGGSTGGPSRAASNPAHPIQREPPCLRRQQILAGTSTYSKQ